MLFNSFGYMFLFLPLAVLFYFMVVRFSQKPFMAWLPTFYLVVMSFVFYLAWDAKIWWIILSSMIVNYIIALSVMRWRYKIFLWLGLLFDLGFLGYFKYTDFFLSNINHFAGYHFALPHIILPLGISFFTFTQMAFLVDSYAGKVTDKNPLRYMLFVTFFPHLLAGPIIHHAEMMPQFADTDNRYINWENMYEGLCFFIIGFFKKVVIADTFAKLATHGYGDVASLGFWGAWGTTLSYTLQIYFDFSGYTDMAIGSALFFNIRLPFNFNSPYKAVSIQDFWRRWHITLSRFLKDYLYIAMGGSRVKAWRIYVNLFVTFILGGLWHGAGWTFIIWGALHGFANNVMRLFRKMGLILPVWCAWFVTFLFIHITWIFFRAEHVHDAWAMVQRLYGAHHGGVSHVNVFTWFLLFVALVACVRLPNSQEIVKRYMDLKWGPGILIVLMVTACWFLISSSVHPFIYFQF